MGEEAINDAMQDISARKRIVALLQNNEDIFNNIKKQLLEKDEDYVYDLKKDTLSESFENSIRLGHFQWIIDKTKNHNKTTFNSKYTIRDCNDLYPAYCDFHKIFINEVNKMSLSKLAQSILTKYIKTLIKVYCN